MSWKLTIDVIFNSFPLIKNKNLILFLCHCERSEAIQWLQSAIVSEVKQSNDFNPPLWAKWSNPVALNPSLRAKRDNPLTSTPSLRTKWSNPVTLNPSLRVKQWFQRGCGEKIPRIKGFKGSQNFLMQGLMLLRGKWTFQCKHSKFLGVYGQKNAGTQRN